MMTEQEKRLASTVAEDVRKELSTLEAYEGVEVEIRLTDEIDRFLAGVGRVLIVVGLMIILGFVITVTHYQQERIEALERDVELINEDIRDMGYEDLSAELPTEHVLPL